MLQLLWELWGRVSVITSPNPNGYGWNLEYKWGNMACTHKKLGKITTRVLPKGANCQNVFFFCQAPISTVFKIKDVNRCVHVCTSEKFPNFCAGVFQASKTGKMGNFEGVLVCRVWHKRQNFGQWELFSGLVNIPRLWLLYTSFGKECTVWALWVPKFPNCGNRCHWSTTAQDEKMKSRPELETVNKKY